MTNDDWFNLLDRFMVFKIEDKDSPIQILTN